MSAAHLTAERWERVTSYGDAFTCYSAAMATWAAAAVEEWPAIVNPGLSLTVTDAVDGIFGFAYFPPSLRAELGLLRAGADNAAEAIDGVLGEIAQSGRVIVAGDGFRLPWHVAFERRHVPHWYVLQEAPEGLAMFDAFTARNALGMQNVTRQVVSRDCLPQLLLALPKDDPIFRLREVLAFGDDTTPLPWHAYQWFVHGKVDAVRKPEGADGPEGLIRLAAHFRDRGQDLGAYGQADDIWSIGRHRAFLCRLVQENVVAREDGELARWLEQHVAPLAKRWSHVAPLLMQATLALESGRPASTSVADVLEELAEREEAAAQVFPGDLATAQI